MLRVVIAEDEELIREGLKSSVHWDTLGLKVTGTASDGMEAVNLCRKKKPDILITDIKMPLLDGLEVIRRIREMKRDMTFLIISGHDDFQYAQQAIKLGVSDYFLKPIEIEKLEDKLREIIKKIEDERSETETSLKMQDFLNHVFPFLKREYFLELLYGPYENEDVAKKLVEMGVLGDNSYFATVLIEMRFYTLAQDSNIDIEETYAAALKNSYYRGDEIFLIKRTEDTALFVVVFIAHDSESLQRKIDKYKMEVMKLDMVLYVSSGMAYRHIDNLHKSYIDAGKELLLKQVFHDRGIQDHKPADSSEIFRAVDFRAIEDAIQEANKTQLNEQLGIIDRHLSNPNRSEEYAKVLLVNLFLLVNKLIDKSGMNLQSEFNNLIRFIEYERDEKTYKRIFKDLTRLCHVFMDLHTTRRDTSAKYLIKNAKEFIQQHFSDWNLSMEDVAEFVGLNPSYFSTTFKSVEGINYIEYVTKKRMAKAKQLLRDERMKISAVAQKVGYNNPAYFNYLFKKFFSITPTEFRSNLSL